jgi:hypothetical protein
MLGGYASPSGEQGFREFVPMTLWLTDVHNNPTYVAVTQRVAMCSLVLWRGPAAVLRKIRP